MVRMHCVGMSSSGPMVLARGPRMQPAARSRLHAAVGASRIPSPFLIRHKMVGCRAAEAAGDDKENIKVSSSSSNQDIGNESSSTNTTSSGSASSSTSRSQGSTPPAPAPAPIPAPVPVKRSGWAGAFDSLAPRTQLLILSGLFIVAMIGLPFLQPTFMYGGSPQTAASQAAEAMVQEQPQRSSRPIPIVTPFLNALQDFSMPRTLPDGRVESPGVVRIYIASMAILAFFYACSAVVQMILNGVAAMLRAAGILKGGAAPKPQA